MTEQPTDRTWIYKVLCLIAISCITPGMLYYLTQFAYFIINAFTHLPNYLDKLMITEDALILFLFTAIAMFPVASIYNLFMIHFIEARTNTILFILKSLLCCLILLTIEFYITPVPLKYKLGLLIQIAYQAGGLLISTIIAYSNRKYLFGINQKKTIYDDPDDAFLFIENDESAR